MNYGQTFVNIKTLNETFDGNATFFRKGRYLEQLQSFVKVFQRKQLFVLSSAEMFKNTKNVMELIRQFIDVPDDPIFQKALPHGKSKVFSCLFHTVFVAKKIFFVLIVKFMQISPLFLIYLQRVTNLISAY